MFQIRKPTRSEIDLVHFELNSIGLSTEERKSTHAGNPTIGIEIMMFTRSSSVFVLSVAMAANLFCWMTEHTHAFEEKAGRVQTTKARRENGLDHWDSDTLAYYLDNYPGYDLAVMFYAQWDTNSHQLAPYWNQIAHDMDAGSSQSKIIMVRRGMQGLTHGVTAVFWNEFTHNNKLLSSFLEYFRLLSLLSPSMMEQNSRTNNF